MRKLTNREKRLLVLFSIFMTIYLADFYHRFWWPSIVRETEHYKIYSTATAEQTDEIAEIVEIVYAKYLQLFEQFGFQIQEHPKLKMKLFRDREEFRRCNRIYDWAEAFYRKPYCYQYYSAEEVNPYHWMMHEATHQLNAEAAKLKLSHWLDEGIACYISTSQIIDGSLSLGQIDLNTYPVWWLASMAQCGDLEMDKNNESVIPLLAIISGKGGPDINKYFNLYYLHWWSFIHFLMHYENGKYILGLGRLIKEGGDVSAFGKYIGDIELVEEEWYEYVRNLKQELFSKDPVLLKR